MSYPSKSMSKETTLINQHQLPLTCPLPNSSVLFEHPKVFLQFKHNEAVCPYCGAHFQIIAES